MVQGSCNRDFKWQEKVDRETLDIRRVWGIPGDNIPFQLRSPEVVGANLSGTQNNIILAAPGHYYLWLSVVTLWFGVFNEARVLLKNASQKPKFTIPVNVNYQINPKIWKEAVLGHM
uniref:Uncharacterized protein n=1 Tax=Glossina brevipalpis TaxID=37001 RepID=A0A1A9W7V7_9MUSC